MLGAGVVALAVVGYFAWWAGPSTTSSHAWLHPQITRELARNMWFVLADGYASTGLFIAALVVYGSWPRARYFGNTAPLLVAFAAGGSLSPGPGLHHLR